MGFLQRFMAGRYGGDALGTFTLALYLLLWLAGRFTGWWPVHLLTAALALLTLYRMFSRDLSKRRAENRRFLSLAAPIRSRLRIAKARWADKTHRYFKCPGCGQQLRAPKGAGKIRVTCRSCGASFEKTC